jgi:hypothetical protein
MKANSPLSIAPLFWFTLLFLLLTYGCKNKDAHPNAYGAPELLPCGASFFSYTSPDGNASIYIPSVFTPNKDSINDTLYVHTQGLRRISVEIFDVNGGGRRVYIRNASGTLTSRLLWFGNSNEAGASPRVTLNQRVYQIALKWTEFDKDRNERQNSAYHNVLLLRNSGGMDVDSVHRQPLTERDCQCAKNGTFPRQVNKSGLIPGARSGEVLNCP